MNNKFNISIKNLKIKGYKIKILEQRGELQDYIKDINNSLLRRAIDKNLIQLNAFLKQVRVYRTANSFKYIDMRYNDLIIVKNNNLPVE